MWFKMLLVMGLMLITGGNVMAHEKSVVVAGGCFWCLEHDLKQMSGTIAVESGYAGGTVASPTYEQVSSGKTGHREVVRVTYNTHQITLEKILQAFFDEHDFTDAGGQYCDRGEQYTPAIFYANDEEKAVAEKVKAQVQERVAKKGLTVITKILPLPTGAGQFWRAEEYHQDFSDKNPEHYARYSNGCGRKETLEELKR